MGSTARQRGVYGGEYALTGLRLFAWWRKNGERRLQKPGSGSTENRSRRPVRSCSFYRRSVLNQKLGQKTAYVQRTQHRATTRSHRCDRIASMAVRSSQEPSWPPAHLEKAHPGQVWPSSTSECQDRPGRLDHIERARRSWSLRCHFFLFLYLFLLNKY
jgi:hypothetical protein